MSSTYSPNLRVELIGTGDQAGTWGSTTNTNLGTLLENAVSGYVSVSITSANQALTALNGADDQARNAVLALTTTTGANFAVFAPPSTKTYTIYNASAYTAIIYNSTVLGNTTAAGAGVPIFAGKTVTVWTDGTNFVFQNNHLSSLTLATDLAIADGGTGASTAADARTNLGVTATGADTAYAFRANNLSDLASATSARTNLGLGSMATQNSNTVSITGGSVTGITDIAVADGGTGASTAADARTNLGVTATGADTAYAFRANNLSDVASASTSRTNLGLGTIATQNSNAVSITGGSVTGITDIAVADGGTGSSTSSGARTNLGVAIGSDVQAYDADLTALGGLAKTDGNFIVGNGTTWVAESGSTARTSLGLGSMSLQNSNSVAVTGGTITGLSSALPTASGGTGLATVGTSGQVLSSNGTTLQWATPAPGYTNADALSLFNASGAAPVYACRAWARVIGKTTLAANGNFASVADGGAGIVQFTFTTAMPDANYAVVVSPSPNNTGQFGNSGVTYVAYDQTTTGFKVCGRGYTGSNNTTYFIDSGYTNMGIAVFR